MTSDPPASTNARPLAPAELQQSACSPALPNVPGGWATRDVVIAGRSFRLTLPADPDAFLDDQNVLDAHARDGYMPYWGYLWPTSLEMATAVLEHTWAPGLAALEIGAGIGLTGLAGLAAGLHVTFSDYDQQAVELAVYNARQNGLEHARGLWLDWRTPPAEQFPLIIGCDVIYEQPNHAPILNLLATMLAPEGECWLADPGRHKADAFINSAREQAFEITLRPLKRLPTPGRPDGVTNLWILRKPQ